MRTAAIVPAAGRGERLGPGTPKALRDLGGQPLLVHAVRALSIARSVELVVVAAPRAELAAVRSLLSPAVGDTELLVVGGGRTRQESVSLALAVLPADVDVVLVHDAARPLAPSELVDAVSAAVRAGADAVVPGIPVADTVKQVDTAGRVERTLDRAQLRAVQTPQGFSREVLVAAHQAAADDASDESDAATDDAGLVERIGRTVLVVGGAEEAFKVTRPIDLVLAEAVLARRRAAGVTG
ncbi:MAG TPA: 2-C-methyl-D-erythritol 4-phosphate cytidylyltransferase [Actinomycetes bacterium]|nr:2-C-methyl-D-erythritol 4-phosphate cytidylyltransferase [Actinomycetes bacterium]